jgi:hypothetical protein
MYIPASDVQEIIDSIESLGTRENETVLIMLADKHLPDVDSLIKELNHRKIDFFGAIFPGLIYGSEKFHSGAIVQSLPVKQRPVLVRSISNPINCLEDQLMPGIRSYEDSPTAFIIVDGLSHTIVPFLSSVFNMFAGSINYLGGGAGSLSFEEQPCIFNPDGFFKDSAIIAFLDVQSSIGVRHGWNRFMGPLVATKTDGNTIKELNWKNAFEVFREAVERDSGRQLDHDNFFEISVDYAFGIVCEDEEDIVRDALKVNDQGELICAGEVPENAVLNIMKGEDALLIKAAEQAVEDCLAAGIKDVDRCIVMDCIARTMFLKEDINEELSVIAKSLVSGQIHVVPEGALSIGEIASRGEGILEFFNKTMVIGVFNGPKHRIRRDI